MCFWRELTQGMMSVKDIVSEMAGEPQKLSALWPDNT